MQIFSAPKKNSSICEALMQSWLNSGQERNGDTISSQFLADAVRRTQRKSADASAWRPLKAAKTVKSCEVDVKLM